MNGGFYYSKEKASSNRFLPKEMVDFILPEKAPTSFHLLAKPTGAICNLDCAYCFFLDKEVFTRTAASA
jgi:sulfatase maturation enzyme AslB (radical SAM superfamily)